MRATGVCRKCRTSPVGCPIPSGAGPPRPTLRRKRRADPVGARASVGGVVSGLPRLPRRPRQTLRAQVRGAAPVETAGSRPAGDSTAPPGPPPSTAALEEATEGGLCVQARSGKTPRRPAGWRHHRLGLLLRVGPRARLVTARRDRLPLAASGPRPCENRARR